MPINRYNNNDIPTLNLVETHEIALSKKTENKAQIVLVKKGWKTYLGKRIYSFTYSYDLVKIKAVLDKMQLNDPASPDLHTYSSIYNIRVEKYKKSLWTRLMGADPSIIQIHHLATKTLNTQPNEAFTSDLSTHPSLTNLSSTPSASSQLQDPSSFILPPVPPDGIRVGLPNIDETDAFGYTCWHNAILQFFASGTEFDVMLTQKIPPGLYSEEAMDLQEKLRHIVAMLRSGKTAAGELIQAIPTQDYIDLLQSLKQLRNPYTNRPIFSSDEGIGYQQDAYEYLIAICQALFWPPSDNPSNKQESNHRESPFPKLARVFTPANQTPIDKVKWPTISPNIPFIDLHPMLSNQSSSIDLVGLIRDDTVIQNVSQNSADPLSNRFDWSAHKCFLNLPETLLVVVHRSSLQLETNNQSLISKIFHRIFRSSRPFSLQKIGNPIQLDDNGMITFMEYKPIFEREHIIAVKPWKICRYQIATSITHLGTSSNRGHYICEERTPSGFLLQHSDLNIQLMQDATNFGVHGSVLRLQKIDEIVI